MKIVFALLLIFSIPAFANDDYHFAGWFNTFVPGGGAFLESNPLTGFEQVAIEGGTFGIGYSLSNHSTFSLDGSIETYPGVSVAPGLNNDHQTADWMRPLSASLLQEVGIKYHFVNVFESYRDAYVKYGGDAGQGIDTRSTLEIFKDPFREEVLASPYVWIPLVVVAGATAIDYHSQVTSGSPQIQRLNTSSNSLLGFNQLALYPVGSGAPEEMFYRGFLQNEAYHAVKSPFFAIPISTAAFSFSHLPNERLTAGASGAYLGFLAFKNKGNLAESTAVHFWSVVILGIESFFLTLHAQSNGTPIGTQVSFNF